MTKARYLPLVGLALLLGGCAAVTRTWDAWFGEAPPPTPSADSQRAQVFYAASDGVALRAQPSGSSEIVARLSLHQRVTRTGLTRGYANVTTDTGLVGWVDNAQLLWRLPAAAAATATPRGAAAPAAGEATPAPAVEAVEPAAATPAVTADTPLPTATDVGAPPPTSTPATPPTKGGAEPAIFDPF